jgi:four helix bundle protein
MPEVRMKVENLDVFKLAHELVLMIYKITSIFPKSEQFGLISQMRRAAASICMNLMEGAHRISKNEFRHFISIAKGSCGELKYQLLLSRDLEYLTEDKYTEMNDVCERVSMMLTRLHSSLK